jgi:hypothetical protein
VIRKVYEKIEARGIWIPFSEVEKYCFSKTTKVIKGFNPNNIEIAITSEKPNE